MLSSIHNYVEENRFKAIKNSQDFGSIKPFLKNSNRPTVNFCNVFGKVLISNEFTFDVNVVLFSNYLYICRLILI